MALHVIGNICTDTTLAVPRFPEAGETLVAGSSRVGLGGKGLNQAVAAARTGAAVVLHAAVGRGDVASIGQALAGERGLALRLHAGPGPTDTSTVLVRPDGENLIVSATACALAFDAAEALAESSVVPGDILLMQGNLAPPVTQAALRAANRAGATTVLNPSPLWATPPAWDGIAIVVLNAAELRHVSGEATPAGGARRLLAGGVGAVVVTLGRDGALWIDAARHLAVPATPVQACDTAGAGDVFCGVLVGLLAQGRATGDALAQATAAASLSVTRPGALASCPGAQEIAALSPLEPARSPA